MKKYLSISLLHPKLVRGGGQQIAYEVFKGAQEDPEISAHLLAGIDPALPNANTPPGAVFTGLDGEKNENLLVSYGFDVRNHLQTSWFVIEKLKEYFEDNSFDWIHFHHSLFVGLDMLDIVKQMQPQAKIFYTLHEYLPICLADGQLKKKYNKSMCYDPTPQACFKCFPELSVDYFFLRNQLFQSKFDLVDHFITPSEFTRGRFIEWGIAPERITVIPNGQENINKEPVTLASKPKADKETRFAFFGQMIDNKGAHLLVEAALLLAEAFDREEEEKQAARSKGKDTEEATKKEKRRLPFKIYFYGGNMQFASQEYREKLEKLLASCDDRLREALVFHGEYTHEQLPGIMRSVDCVVTPSTWFEVFGLVVSEAWMFGKPVIAADIGGLSERINDGENGLKFRPNDAQDLADRMREYMEDYVTKGKGFPGIVPPIGRDEFWHLHREIFESHSASVLRKKKAS